MPDPITMLAPYVEPAVKILLWFIIILFSSIPLYLAARLLGGRTGIIKVIFVNFIAGIIIPLIKEKISFLGGIIAFIVLLLIYKVLFRVGWIRALLIWIVQFIIIALIALVIALLAGIVLL